MRGNLTLLRESSTSGSLRKVAVATLAMMLSLLLQACPRAVTIPEAPVVTISEPIPRITADTACWSLIERSADSSSLVPMAQNCAQEEDTRRRGVAIRHTSRVMTRTAAMFMNIPEYHDEQRLTDGSQGYGPMAYIFAMPTLDGFKDSVQFGSHGARGVLVGVVYVLKLNNSPPLLPATYTALSLDYGMNCVYLAFRRQATPNERWKSYIKPANADTTCTPDETPDTLLPVKRISIPDNSGIPHRFEDYPPVARFDESTTGKPLLGFKCVDGWCMIGLDAGHVRPPMSGPGGREGRINGWHDEQVLTIRTAPGDFQGVFRAKLTPRAHLERVTLDTLRNWTHMATMTLVGPPVGEKYSTWGMRRGDNRMELRLNPGNSQWEARMIAPAFGSTPEDTTALRFVERHEHFDVAVPATARFRWTLADDGIWVPCDLGCCKVEGVAVAAN